MVTYNHEKYIEKAIQSILMQKTNFRIELVIGEDFSKDGTASIIKEYADKYADKIKASFNNPNLGMMKNVIKTMEACKGKYIAICDGDDYWTDPEKLQKQVDILESNNDYQLVFHNALVTYINNPDKEHLFANLKQGEYSGDDILLNWIIPTGSVVYRNNIDIKKLLPDVAFPDIFLFLLNAEKGKLYGIEDVMSVYQKVPTSVTNVDIQNIAFKKSIIKQYNDMNSAFSFKYSDTITKHKFELYFSLLNAYKYNKNRFGYYNLLLKIIVTYPLLFTKKVFNYTFG